MHPLALSGPTEPPLPVGLPIRAESPKPEGVEDSGTAAAEADGVEDSGTAAADADGEEYSGTAAAEADGDEYSGAAAADADGAEDSGAAAATPLVNEPRVPLQSGHPGFGKAGNRFVLMKIQILKI